MEEIILAALSFIGELLVELLVYFPWDLFIGSHERKSGGLNPFGWIVVSVFTGMLAGYLSTLFLPGILIKYSWLRIINLMFAPFGVGAISLEMSKRRKKRELISNHKLHYLSGFFITFAIAGTRYVLATK